MPARSITIITTGGTIEKTYDEASGLLVNRGSILKEMLGGLRLEDTVVSVNELLSKDSLFMTDEDRDRVVAAVRTAAADRSNTGIVILHGTDTLCVTGDRLHAELPTSRIPIILTGAMRPYEMTRSDALQNLTEAIFASGTLAAGVYCVAHGRALRFPGVAKDKARGTFIQA